MSKIEYRKLKLSSANKHRLDIINGIIEEYSRDGLVLTLRQLYYQLVSRAVIPNEKKEYAKLSVLLKEGRMGGIVDWDAIEDRLRVPDAPGSWDSIQDIARSAVRQFRLDRTSTQDNYVEVWVEKDALSGVLSPITYEFHVPLLVCRGYSSATAVHDAYLRFERYMRLDKKVSILYLGDFDPSGLDMHRDITERVREFYNSPEGYSDVREFEDAFRLKPIALTYEQIQRYKPPVNPAKMTDPRHKDYVKKYGIHSWEVDALPPKVLNELLRKELLTVLDMGAMEEIIEEEDRQKQKFSTLLDAL